MTCGSLLYATSTSTTSITSGSNVQFNKIVRRYGRNIVLNNYTPVIAGRGYYNIDTVFTGVASTAVASTAGTVTLALYQDDVQIPGATVTTTVAAGDTIGSSLSTLICLKGCCCNEAATSVVTLVVSGAGDVTPSNAAIRIIKV
jgi:hypothetical protein